MVSTTQKQKKKLINVSISVTWFPHAKLTDLSLGELSKQHCNQLELAVAYSSLWYRDFLHRDVSIPSTKELQDRKTVPEYSWRTFRYLFLLHAKEELEWTIYMETHIQTEIIMQAKEIKKKKKNEQTFLSSKPILSNVISQEQCEKLHLHNNQQHRGKKKKKQNCIKKQTKTLFLPKQT